MDDDAIVWDRVEWRQGDGHYRFEVAKGGLHATFSAPTGASLTLPTVAWEALLDAIAAARKTKARGSRAMPARAGARWSTTEADELVAAFKSGASIDGLAAAHNRTVYAIEAQLAALGLWDRHAGAPREQIRASRPMIPPDWPPVPPASSAPSSSPGSASSRSSGFAPSQQAPAPLARDAQSHGSPRGR